ncbi:hypothetical protein JOF53_001110 [Crossiella equi]|uniref:Uncharacterized protein n=1 Tax=Crossiella equi TaxID=130796 RepID=A0ABS5A6L8_9PSEU|nr:hypothetical protein [Crossiella equi]MBP2472238.1 hypothetical protein [Crossiella equi]
MSNAFQQHLDGLVPHLEVADLAEAAARLPRDTRLVLTQPDAAWTAAELATFLGRPVFAVNGLSTPDGARVPGPDGPGWAPYAQVLRHHPGQEPPDVAALLPPARWLTAGHGLVETGPAAFRLGDVVVRVVEAGLLLHPRDTTPAALPDRRADPGGPVVTLGVNAPGVRPAWHTAQEIRAVRDAWRRLAPYLTDDPVEVRDQLEPRWAR